MHEVTAVLEPDQLAVLQHGGRGGPLGDGEDHVARPPEEAHGRKLPDLGDPVEEIPRLAEYFVRKYVHSSKREIHGVSPDALRQLKQHNWPGNIAELEHVIQHATIMGSSEWIKPDDF